MIERSRPACLTMAPLDDTSAVLETETTSPLLHRRWLDSSWEWRQHSAAALVECL